MENSQIRSEKVKPDMVVHAKAAGQTGDPESSNIGTVDHMDGDRYIKLKKSDSPDGRHHWIPLDWVEKVDNTGIYLSKTEQEAQIGMFNSFPGINSDEKQAS